MISLLHIPCFIEFSNDTKDLARQLWQGEAGTYIGGAQICKVTISLVFTANQRALPVLYFTPYVFTCQHVGDSSTPSINHKPNPQCASGCSKQRSYLCMLLGMFSLLGYLAAGMPARCLALSWRASVQVSAVRPVRRARPEPGLSPQSLCTANSLLS